MKSSSFDHEDTWDNWGKSSIVTVLLVFAAISFLLLGILFSAFLLSENSRKTKNVIQNVSTAESTMEHITDSTQEETQDTVSEEDTIGVISYDENFYSDIISDEIFDRMEGHSFNSKTPITRDELRYVHVLIYGVDEQPHVGEIVVNKCIAEDVLDIFRELYESKYMIEKMNLVDDYGADDNASMIVNNTSGFNTRKIMGTEEMSRHSYGMAIDINPLYNPYVVSDAEVYPATARQFVDRDGNFDMKIDESDLCYKLFIEHGFTWGGNWENIKDYMHFEKR